MSRANALARRVALALVTALLPLAPSAQTGQPLVMSPFSGESGHQEIRLGPDSWFLAYHGTRQHAAAAVEAAWLARAAQLCLAAGKTHVVELAYVGEPTLVGETLAADAAARPQPVAGPVYLPIFIPSGPHAVTPTITPSKQAAMRCVDASATLRPGKVSTAATEALQAARAAGVVVP